jgi:hypothetical protein
MKNLHLIPTDKQSRLCYVICTEKSTLTLFEDAMDKASRFFPQHIYITSDDEIKEGDWVINPYTEYPYKADYKVVENFKQTKDFHIKKIILTTDQDLIADGVQVIDDTFLEWFVKNPNCEEVEVEIETTSIQLPQQQLSENSYDLAFRWINKKVYKIIIPQEEPKQETLEEVEKNIDREEWINFFKNNSKEEILEYLINYKFPL